MLKQDGCRHKTAPRRLVGFGIGIATKLIGKRCDHG
jgi:hypothetical protein